MEKSRSPSWKKTCSQPSRAAWPVSRSWINGYLWRWNSWLADMASWSAFAQPSCGPGWGEASGRLLLPGTSSAATQLADFGHIVPTAEIQPPQLAVLVYL
jgi:hypothetical protein